MGAPGTEPLGKGVRPTFGARLPGIEGLRAVAAGAIVVYHVWLFSPPDGVRVQRELLDHVLPDLQFGVTLFFSLSGFLLYRAFAASLLRGEALPSVRAYLANRGLRIVPAYWVILLFTALVLQSALVRDGAALNTGPIWDPGVLVRDLAFVQDYAPDTLATGIGPAWTLAVEVVFYLLLPLLAVAAAMVARRASRRAVRRLVALGPPLLLLAVGLCGKATAGLIVRPVAPYEGFLDDWHSVVERSFLCQADLFAFGMIVAVARIDWEDGLFRPPRHWRPVAAIAAIGGYLVTARATHFGEQLSYSGYNTLMALVCALVIALVVLPAPASRGRPRLVRVLESRPLVAGGVISYSLFLWHDPLTRFMRAHDLTVGGTAGLPLNLVIVGGAAVALSVLTYRFVEAPALRLKSRSPRNGPRPARAPLPQ